MEIILKEESYAIMGACFEVYNNKGPGFLEPVYQELIWNHDRNQPPITRISRIKAECRIIEGMSGPTITTGAVSQLSFRVGRRGYHE